MKRLFADIETSPNVVLSWRIGYKINLDADNILQERAIICAGWKWEGRPRVHTATWDAKHDDTPVIRPLLAAMDEADEIVMHNGDSFDLPWVKTRCIRAGIPTKPAYKTVDTLQWARRRFLFNSNRLDYIARYLGLGGKIKTEFNLWKKVVLDRDAKALRQMVEYCQRDVALLEKVYQKMAAHMPHKTHAGVLAGGEKWHCPHCGSEEVKLNRTLYTASGTAQHQMKCRKCERYYSIGASTAKDYRAEMARRKEAA